MIEQWEEKHSSLLDEYSKGNANNEVMQMYRSQMKNVLDFINQLKQVKNCFIPDVSQRSELLLSAICQFTKRTTQKETQENQSVWAFLYNSDCCESAVSAISIHKTKEGAEIAKELHKAEILKEWEDACKIDECFKNYPFDFDQWWGVKEMPLLP